MSAEGRSGLRRLDGMSLNDQEADVSGLALRGEVASVSCNDAYSFSKPVRDEIVLIPGLGIEGDVHAGVTVRHRHRVRIDPTQPNLRQVHLIPAELHDEVRPAGYDVPAGGLGENVTTNGLDLLKLPRGTVLRFGPPPPAAGPTSREGRPGKRGATSGPTSQEGRPGKGGANSGPGAAAVVEAARLATLDDASAAAVAALADRISAEPSVTSDNRPAIVVTGLRNPCQQINRYRSGLLKQVLGRDERGSPVRKAGVMAVVLRGGAIRPGDAITVDLPAGPYLPLDLV